MWKEIKANLTWAAAAKFYIWAATLAGSLTAEQIDTLPDWLTPVIALLGLSLGWWKSQQPVTREQIEAG